MSGLVSLSFGAPCPTPPPTQASSGQRGGYWAHCVWLQTSLSFCFLFHKPVTHEPTEKALPSVWWIVAFLGFISSPSPTSFTLSSIKFFSLHTFNSYFLLNLLLIVLKMALKKKTHKYLFRYLGSGPGTLRHWDSLILTSPGCFGNWGVGVCVCGLVILELWAFSKAWPLEKPPESEKYKENWCPEVIKGRYHVGPHLCPFFGRNVSISYRVRNSLSPAGSLECLALVMLCVVSFLCLLPSLVFFFCIHNKSHLSKQLIICHSLTHIFSGGC